MSVQISQLHIKLQPLPSVRDDFYLFSRVEKFFLILTFFFLFHIKTKNLNPIPNQCDFSTFPKLDVRKLSVAKLKTYLRT